MFVMYIYYVNLLFTIFYVRIQCNQNNKKSILKKYENILKTTKLFVLEWKISLTPEFNRE